MAPVEAAELSAIPLPDTEGPDGPDGLLGMLR
jgi:hypothetical protein